MKSGVLQIQAKSYIDQVKDFLKQEGKEFRVFQEVMADFRERKICAADVADKVKQLFGHRKDLIVGFNAFLPDGFKIRVDELDAPEENAHVQAAVEFLNKAKVRFKDDEFVYQSLFDALNGNQKCRADVYKEVAALLVDHQDLLEEFDRFILCSQSMIDVKKDEREVSRKGKRKTSDYDDEVDSNGLEEDISQVCRRAVVLFEKLKKNFEDSERYLNFLIKVHEYHMKRIEIGEVIELVAPFPQVKSEFKALRYECQDIAKNNPEKLANLLHKRRKIGEEKSKKQNNYRDKYSEENCTPSYWRVTEDFNVPTYREISDLDGEVLNHQFTCRISDKRNFKIRHIKEHEQVVNKCEDDRFEADMYLHMVESTIKRITELLEGEKKFNFETHFKVEDHLSILHLRCLERLYDGCEIEMLQNNPQRGLTLMLGSLKRQIKECRRNIDDLNKIWAPVYRKCI